MIRLVGTIIVILVPLAGVVSMLIKLPWYLDKYLVLTIFWILSAHFTVFSLFNSLVPSLAPIGNNISKDLLGLTTAEVLPTPIISLT